MAKAKTSKSKVKPVAKKAKKRSEKLARMCAQVAYENRARDIQVLDIGELCSYADYFVVATGDTGNQLRAIAFNIASAMKESDAAKLGEEGLGEGGWALLDYGDVIVQLFEPQAREYYQLEELWGDAGRLELKL